VLAGAADVATRLKRPDGPHWAEIAAGMFIAMDGDVIKNHDRFTPAEGGVTGATPEALAGLFPMTYDVSPQIERATIAFYLDRVEPYIGHPMLSAPLGAFALPLTGPAAPAFGAPAVAPPSPTGTVTPLLAFAG